tara:strand:- start:14753 stop:15271 length:519 start_codon:yes stop_codon:yes gene_type:complete
MASFGTLLSEAFGTVETLENQIKETVQPSGMADLNKVCSKKCMKVFRDAGGNPSTKDTDQYCTPECVTAAQKFMKDMGPSGSKHNSDAHASETPIKESFSSLEGMHHRQPRPGPPRHGPGRHHGHHGNRNPSYILVGEYRGFFKNVKNNLDLLLILSVLIILLVVGLVVMKK